MRPLFPDKFTFSFILMLLISYEAPSQDIDSIQAALGYSKNYEPLVFKVLKIDTVAAGEFYDLLILNKSKSPVCILYSASLIPPDLEVSSLIPYNESGAKTFFSMNYCARDTFYADRRENWNLNALVLLPIQKTSFRIAIPGSAKDKDLKMQYIVLNNFCYNDFHNRIYSSAATWYESYVRIDKHLFLK